MTPPTQRFATLVRQTVAELDDNWDVDEDMPESRLDQVAYGRLLLTLHHEDPEALGWLCFFVARRAVACWQANTDDPTLPTRLEMLSAFYLHNRQPDWELLAAAVASPFQDCRFSDTQSAADAVAWAARYARHRTPAAAVYCVSSADVAYAHVLTEHEFRRWFLEVALPDSLKKVDMGTSEREAYRPGSSAQPAL